MFAVPTLLNCLRRVSLLSSSLYVPSEVVPVTAACFRYIMGTAGSSTSPEATCVHRCIVKGKGLWKDMVFHKSEVFLHYTVWYLLKVNCVNSLALPLFRMNWWLEIFLYIVVQLVKERLMVCFFLPCSIPSIRTWSLPQYIRNCWNSVLVILPYTEKTSIGVEAREDVVSPAHNGNGHWNAARNARLCYCCIV